MTMSNGVTGGVFATLADLQASKARVDTIVQLTNGAKYSVDVADGGAGLGVNGLFANPIKPSPEHFGAVGDGVADDTSALLSFFALNVKEKYLTAGAVYRTNSQLENISDTVIYGNGAEIKAFDGGTGEILNKYATDVRTVIGFSSVSDVTIYDLKVNGSSASFGGVQPDANTGTSGFLVWTSCSRIKLVNCVSEDVSRSGFIALNNGALGVSEDVTFLNCLSISGGIGFGQEILFAGGTGGLHGSAPINTSFINCVALPAHSFGLYLAGGVNTKVIGGKYANNRNDLITLYTGDAQGTLDAVIVGATFDGTNNASNNNMVIAHSVNAQPVNVDQYLNPSDLSVAFYGCRFECANTQEQPVDIEKNSKVSFTDCEFKNVKVRNNEAIAGAVNPVNYPVKYTGCTFDTTTATYLLTADIKVNLNNCTFTSLTATRAIFLDTGANESAFNCCIFGTDRTGEAIAQGFTFVYEASVSVTDCDFTNCATPFNITTANSHNLKAINNKAGTFNAEPWRKDAAAPTTGTHSRGDIRWNSNASAGGKVGFVCVTAGTPGTWKAFGVIDV